MPMGIPRSPHTHTHRNRHTHGRQPPALPALIAPCTCTAATPADAVLRLVSFTDQRRGDNRPHTVRPSRSPGISVSLGRLPTHFQINYGGGVDAPFGPTHETPLQELSLIHI